ncbi:hypothetical protein [Actinomadura sp. 6N118]|uniref:hypothetical protein n=1 Tax=Actinomadura sp. 6N118 TaxID=3375151 RepID=UPI0037952A11
MKSAPWPASSPFAKEHERRGEEKGERRALLTVLNARGLEVSAVERERITSCCDIDQLQEWVRRAATMEATAELFS